MTVVGIEGLHVYAGVAAIDVAELFRGRGLDEERIENIQQTRRSIGLGFEDPVTNAVAAAKPIVDMLDEAEREKIEAVITSTESGVDYSKSVASYVHRYLGLSRTCRIFEVKQACYAATGALQMAVAYVASGLSPGAKVLVIATDVALVDAHAEYAEPATGFGAAAMLIGSDPKVLRIDPGAFGFYGYETLDSARPTPTADIADVDRSLFAYLDCLSNSFADYRRRVVGADILETFGHLCMHTPFAGLVQAGHRKLLKEFGVRNPEAVQADFERRLSASLVYPKEVGNLCSGSVYLALASLIDNRPEPDPTRVGLFSYGSGCASEFYSGMVDSASREAIRPHRLRESLQRRTRIDFQRYEALLQDNLEILVPHEDRDVPVERYQDLLPEGRPAMLALTGIRGFHRQYEWI